MKEYIFDYLSEILLEFFSTAHITPGERFHIRYEQQDQVDKQFNALFQTAVENDLTIHPFNYNGFDSHVITFRDYRLILAASSPATKDDFLTGLRNRVSENSTDLFQRSAILFIHKTSLDSIIGGCKSLTESGMPLNMHRVREKIGQRLNNNDDFQAYERNILEYKLAQIGKGNDDAYSLFNYAIFLEILGKKKIAPEDYIKLGLFADKGLKSLDKTEAEKRLKQNEEWFTEINNGHQYGGVEKFLEKTFSQQGVDRLTKDDWADTDFKAMAGWEQEKNETNNITYVPNHGERTDDLQVIWDRAEGTTPSKSRIRHMIIFNHDGREKINLTLNFEHNRPARQGITKRHNLSEEEFNISGKKILLSCQLEDPRAISLKGITYLHPGFSARYQFHLLIVPFAPEMIENIKTGYLIRPVKNKGFQLEVEIDTPLILNQGHSSKLTEEIKNGLEYELRDQQTLELNYQPASSDQEDQETCFALIYADQVLPIQIALQRDKPEYRSGAEVRAQKWSSRESFRYHSAIDVPSGKETVTLSHATSKYYVTDEFRESLRLENQLVLSGKIAFYQNWNQELIANEDIVVSDAIHVAYQQLISYFRQRELLPSLAVIDAELETLYLHFLSLYSQALEGLEEGKALSKAELDLLKIATIEMRSGSKLLKFTPLHPINIAYQLNLKGVLTGTVHSYLLDKLKPINLVPYIRAAKDPLTQQNYHYQPLEQGHSPEWLYYFLDEVANQQVSRYFVDGLVEQKIEQFLKHFQYLFTSPRAQLRINLHHQGDAREILRGVMLYYSRFLRKENLNPDDAVAIQVNIYGSNDFMTKFEELALCEEARMVETGFDFKFPPVPEPDDLLDLYNRKVTFFKSDAGTDFQYAHLSFYCFSPKEISKSANNMLDVPSGISLRGLMADVPSVSQKDSFRTGFGMQGVEAKGSPLLTLAQHMNAFANVTHTDNQYDGQDAMAFVINRDATQTIRAVYAKSQWVTFIEPKVDLTFFKSFDDVVIIHYSDQYNNASGYDAITITSKWEPYKATIMEVLEQQHIPADETSVIRIIDQFNALNGQWLLGLNSPSKNNQTFRMEKLSLLSAVKAALAVLDHPKITWVPISLEEILRVSGAVGLKKADGLFSVKNLGSEGIYSDDLLMIGVEEAASETLLHFYPFEVKIGQFDATILQKATEQSARTATLLRTFLTDESSLSGKIYRNFFAKLLLIGAEKSALYNIWPNYTARWEEISALRPKLLNDEFKVSSMLDDYIGQYGVIGFKWSDAFFSRSLVYENDGAIATLLKKDGLEYLTKDVTALSNALESGEMEGIAPAKLLRNRYQTERSEAPVAHVEAIPKEMLAAVPEVPAVPKTVDNIEAVQLSFNQLSKHDIAAISAAIYEKLSAIGIEIKKEFSDDINFIEGPAFYRIEIKPEPTTTFKKIKSAVEELNIALHLPEEASVRVFFSLGKVWLEAPKGEGQKIPVTTAHIWPLFSKDEEFRVPFGVDITGAVQCVNFSSSNSPHLLLAGTTGSGKSVVLDTLIRSAIKFYTPLELQVFLVDPKGNELINFEGLPHLPKPNGMGSAEAIELLQDGVTEMDRRYQAFKDIRHRSGSAAKDLIEYNRMVDPGEQMARWLIVLDEYSDLLDEDAANKATIETLLRRLAQKARAAGIHVIIATQKPLASIVSSAIKSNLPGVIALRVRSTNDSRVILDDNGAETLAGKGDSLFKNGTGQMTRVQAAIHRD